LFVENLKRHFGIDQPNRHVIGTLNLHFDAAVDLTRKM